MQEAWLEQCCGAMIFGYDAMGRVVLNNQCLPDYCPSGGVPLSYTYDLAGDMTSYTNGAGVTLSQGFDTAGRIAQLTSSLSDAQHPGTLATVDASVGYYPSGELRKATFGNGLTETAAYNNRLQPCRLNVNMTGGVLGSCNDAVIPGLGDFTYAYNAGTADNGNVVSFSSNGTQNFNRSYTYDSLNRLQSMSSPGDICTGLSWTYDAWANRTDQTVTGGSCNSFHQAANAQNGLAAAPYQYGAAGNMTNDGSHSYTYDAENRLIQVDGSATAAYKHDALGRRIRKNSGSGWTDYVYDASGAVVTKYINGISNCTWPCWQATYISMGGKLTAEYKDGATYFFSTDHVGSTRFLTRSDQTLADSMDYLPYGEQIAGASETTHKFTGKERDAETQLDYFGARYYSNGLGRFITPDWAPTTPKPSAVPYADWIDPQSLNQYSYVRNLPTTKFDKDGHDPGDKFKTKTAAAADAIKYIRGKPDGYKNEYGTRIEKNGKSYSYNEPVTQGNPAGVDLQPLQKNDVGDVHTHNYGVDNAHANSIEQPDRIGTVQDKAAVQKMQDDPKTNVDYQSYVGAPNGDVIQFTPNPNAPDGLGDAKTVQRNVAPDPNPPPPQPRKEEPQ